VWAHRRAAAPDAEQFRRVIFQNRRSEGDASRTSSDFSEDSYFCLSFRSGDEALDAVSCASTFNSDKGRAATTAAARRAANRSPGEATAAATTAATNQQAASGVQNEINGKAREQRRATVLAVLERAATIAAFAMYPPTHFDGDGNASRPASNVESWHEGIVGADKDAGFDNTGDVDRRVFIASWRWVNAVVDLSKIETVDVAIDDDDPVGQIDRIEHLKQQLFSFHREPICLRINPRDLNRRIGRRAGLILYRPGFDAVAAAEHRDFRAIAEGFKIEPARRIAEAAELDIAEALSR
jgi:hypothetical protein